MAQYKVPQDVEADDKLLGPFSFRQFVYLLVCGGLIALAVGLFQIFPMLVIIPLPFILLFAALALPLKKDQPMEAYLAALVTFYTKPRTRKWVPGQKESLVQITVPKTKDSNRTRDISGEEVTHRLSFLADIVDTEGYAIKGIANNSMREDLKAEASTAEDIFEAKRYDEIAEAMERNENERHAEVIKEMREAINDANNLSGVEIVRHEKKEDTWDQPDVVVRPDMPELEGDHEKMSRTKPEKNEQNVEKSSIIELANNTDFSIATIEKEANRIKGKEEGEVFISLH